MNSMAWNAGDMIRMGSDLGSEDMSREAYSRAIGAEALALPWAPLGYNRRLYRISSQLRLELRAILVM
jgi:hypothetical protein